MRPIAVLILMAYSPCAPDNKEESHRQAWQALLDREEDYAEKLNAHAGRLHDSESSMYVQLERIKRKEHPDAAAGRVEQALERVEELHRALSAVERDYAKVALSSRAKNDSRMEQLARKQQALAELSDPKEGEIARTRISLTRLLRALETEREPDPQLAVESQKRLRDLERRLSRFVDHIVRIDGCSSPLSLLAVIEAEQRKITLRLQQQYREQIGDPVLPLNREK